MKSRGKESGLALVIILVVAMIVAFLMMKNLGSMGPGKETAAQQEQNYVQQAQSVVDQINQAQQQAAQEP